MKNPFSKKGLKKAAVKKIDAAKKITRTIEISSCSECKHFRVYHTPPGHVCQCTATMAGVFVSHSSELAHDMFKNCTVWPAKEHAGGC